MPLPPLGSSALCPLLPDLDPLPPSPPWILSWIWIQAGWPAVRGEEDPAGGPDAQPTQLRTHHAGGGHAVEAAAPERRSVLPGVVGGCSTLLSGMVGGCSTTFALCAHSLSGLDWSGRWQVLQPVPVGCMVGGCSNILGWLWQHTWVAVATYLGGCSNILGVAVAPYLQAWWVVY